MNSETMLSYEVNLFQGALIETGQLPENATDFAAILRNTMAGIQDKELQLAWLYLPLIRADLVPEAVSQGFIYHHAEEHGLQLVKKVSLGAFVPGYATHYTGVGGVLVDSENRILVIQERYHTKKHYKLPGGALDPGEHISQAAVREVFEETGIKSEFVSLNCFRHWHQYRHGKSDIYFVCRMRPLSTEITIDPTEISKARWMPVDEYLSDPDTHPFNRKIVETSLAKPGLTLDAIPDYGSPETHELMF